MDVTPSAIEQLNYAECYPIVIFFKATDRRQIKQIREEYGKTYQKSSRDLLDVAERLELIYSYLFTSIIRLDHSTHWFQQLKSQIDLEQDQPIWMSHNPLGEKDFLKSDEYFISTKFDRPEEIFFLDQTNSEGKINDRIQRISSDPLLFKKDQTRTLFPIAITSNHCQIQTKSTSMADNDEDDGDGDESLTISLPNRSYSKAKGIKQKLNSSTGLINNSINQTMFDHSKINSKSGSTTKINQIWKNDDKTKVSFS